MQDIENNLKNKLKELRKNVSQKETAEKIGISYANYNKYETSNVLPDIITLSKIADYYNISVDYLIDRKVPNDLGYISSEDYDLFKKISSLSENNHDKVAGYVDSLIEFEEEK